MLIEIDPLSISLTMKTVVTLCTAFGANEATSAPEKGTIINLDRLKVISVILFSFTIRIILDFLSLSLSIVFKHECP